MNLYLWEIYTSGQVVQIVDFSTEPAISYFLYCQLLMKKGNLEDEVWLLILGIYIRKNEYVL